MSNFAQAISDWVAFGANLFTLILGGIALWGLLFRRKKLALVLKVLINNFTNERVKRIKETLGKLDSLSFDEKEDRPEIIALLGQVSGQINNLATDQNDLRKIHSEISALLEKTTRLNEATKRRIIYELHGTIDSLSFEETNKILN